MRSLFVPLFLLVLGTASAQATSNLTCDESGGLSGAALLDTPAVKKLSALGISFEPKAFERAIIDGNIPIIELFLRAGYSPNRQWSNNSFFTSTMVIRNNQGNGVEVIRLLIKCGLDFKQKSLKPDYTIGKAPDKLTQEEELLYMSTFGVADTTTNNLIELGADPKSLIDLYNNGNPNVHLATSIVQSLKKISDLRPSLVSTSRVVEPTFSIRDIKLGFTAEEVQAAAAKSQMRVRRFSVSNRPGVVILELRDATALRNFSASDRARALAEDLGSNAKNAQSGLVMVVLLSAATQKVMRMEVRNAAEDQTEGLEKGQLYDVLVEKFGSPNKVGDSVKWGNDDGVHAIYKKVAVGAMEALDDAFAFPSRHYAVQIFDEAAMRASDLVSNPPPTRPRL